MLTLRSFSSCAFMLVLAWACSHSPQALAQARTIGSVEYPCFNEAGAAIELEFNRAVDRDKAAYRKMFEDFQQGKDSEGFINAMSACIFDGMGSFSFNLTLPSISDLLRSFVRNLIQQVCREVAGRLSSATNTFMSRRYIDSGIPGMSGSAGWGGGGSQGATEFVGGAATPSPAIPQGFIMPNVPSTITWKSSPVQGSVHP